MDPSSSNAAPERPALFIPTQQQIRYLRAYLDPNTQANITSIAEIARVNRRTVYKWLEQPAFCIWFKEQCESLFRHRVPKMWAKCLELAEAGSPDHIKLIAQRGGELQIEAQGTGRDGRAGITQVFLNVPRPQLVAHEAPAMDLEPIVLACQTSEDEH